MLDAQFWTITLRNACVVVFGGEDFNGFDVLTSLCRQFIA